MRIVLIYLISIFLSACSLIKDKPDGDKMTPVSVINDSQGNVLQVQAQLTQDNATEVLKSRAATQENAGYFMALNSLYSNPNLDGRDFAIITMAQSLSGGKMMPTNSNDVEIARVQGEVQKNANMWGGVKFFGGLAAGSYVSGKAIDGFVALGRAAGTSINMNDGNTVDVTQNDVEQTAKGGSTISDSGNIDQAKGIPVNQADLSLTAANQEPPLDGSGLTCPDGFDLRPSVPEDPLDIIVDGFTCSDGQGGGVAPSAE